MRKIFVAVLLCAAGAGAQDLRQAAADVKESAARNQAALRLYSWTEHDEVIIAGQTKRTEDSACRYGPDGKIARTELISSAPRKDMRAIQKSAAAHQKDALQDYLERASALARAYVPPSPQDIQRAVEAGSVSREEAGPGTTQLVFKNYMKAGDSVTLSFNPAAKVLQTMTVSSYLDDTREPVSLTVDFQILPDGATYPATTIVSVKAKKLDVLMQNANYRRIGG